MAEAFTMAPMTATWTISEVDRGHGTPCHIGPWKTEENGYCRLAVGKVRHLAHRYFYELANGTIAPGLEIDHLCRQRDCCNAAHLEPVTSGENRRRGEQGKVTADQVRAIRRDTRLRRVIADDYGISEWHVSAIRGRRRCTDVED